MSDETSRAPEAPPLRGAPARFRFPPHMRLSGKRAFTRVFDEGTRVGKGPLTLRMAPNGLSHCRLGLSIGRRVGNAVRRNRLKRKLRDAFRLLQHDLPSGYDLVVSSRAHLDLPLVDYVRLLRRCVEKATP